MGGSYRPRESVNGMNVRDLPKQYDPQDAQRRYYQLCLDNGYFHAHPDSGRPPYCIVIPPPNVTGALHLGHALNNTLQDILIRWRRMQGYNALWMPGTDHAGIATQAVVEKRLLEKEKKTRHDLGREELVERIWAWKDEYEARILEPAPAAGLLVRLGAHAVHARSRAARAVRRTFFKLFKDGMIFRGKRLVNWDTQLRTAVADDEIYYEEVQDISGQSNTPLRIRRRVKSSILPQRGRKPCWAIPRWPSIPTTPATSVSSAKRWNCR